MTAIILILILAFIAFCNGDSSGFEAIGKIILYIGLFIGVGCIIVYVPWLLLLVVIGIIIWAVVSSKSNSNNNKSNSTYNNYQQQDERIESHFVGNANITDFQRQLQENTKTPEQVQDENWLKEKEQITLIAKSDFDDIKRKLLEKAKNGQYSTSNGQKNISLEYYCSYLLGCIDRQYFYNPTGRMGTSSYRTNEKASYHIGKLKEYNLYLNTIKELALKDNISITPFFTERDVTHNRENRIPMPYTFTHKYGIGVSAHQIKAYLECLIQY